MIAPSYLFLEIECNIPGLSKKLVSCESNFGVSTNHRLSLSRVDLQNRAGDMSSNHGDPFLSNEVIYLVIDQLRDDKTSLSACSLTSKSLFQLCRSYLFASLAIRFPWYKEGSEINLRDVGFFFKNTRNASQYIGRLSFTKDDHCGLLRVGELFKVLESTNALRSLHLRRFTLDFSDIPHHNGSHLLPQLQELSLENGHDSSLPIHSVSSLLSHFPSTSNLSLIGLQSRFPFESPPYRLSTPRLTELHLHNCDLPDLHPLFPASLEVLTLDRIRRPDPTHILLSITPTLQYLRLQSTFSEDDADMRGFADLTRFTTLRHYTVMMALSDSSDLRAEAWRALTGPIPFLPQSLEHFSLIFISGANMQDFLLKPIWTLGKQDGWVDLELGLLALDRLSCVDVSMEHGFEDEGIEQAVEYVKGCHSQLKEVIRMKWRLLDERGLLHFKSSCFGIYDTW